MASRNKQLQGFPTCNCEKFVWTTTRLVSNFSMLYIVLMKLVNSLLTETPGVKLCVRPDQGWKKHRQQQQQHSIVLLYFAV